MNFQIIRAAYTVDPMICYAGICATRKTKLVVIDFAVKNASKNEMSIGGDANYMTLVDESGNQYATGSGCVELASKGGEEFYTNLKPGQGLGQEGLNNPLRVVYEVPFTAKITKIFVNYGRLGKQENVLRFLMAGTDPAADAKNVIAPLPAGVADPADKSGATAMAVGEGKLNSWYSSGLWAYKVTNVSETSEALGEGKAPGDGKKFVIATVTVKRLGHRPESVWYTKSDDCIVKDADGEKTILSMFLKASSPETVRDDFQLNRGEEMTIRFVFEVSKTATIKSLSLAGQGYPWTFDLSKQ